jgi:hypothetical protein
MSVDSCKTSHRAHSGKALSFWVERAVPGIVIGPLGMTNKTSVHILAQEREEQEQRVNESTVEDPGSPEQSKRLWLSILRIWGASASRSSVLSIRRASTS